MKIDYSKLEKFVKKARSIVGRNEHNPFSLEDLYHLASKFELIVRFTLKNLMIKGM